jgi:DNA-binding PadR family transcriptional regulator
VADLNNDEMGQFLPLHPLEFQILLSLMDGVAHAYRIVQEVEARQPSWSRILPTNLYRRIWRLVSLGLIQEVEGEPAADGRSRKYFEILPLGRRVASAEAERLRQLLAEAVSTGVVPDERLGGS